MLKTLRSRAKRPTIPRVLILGLDSSGKTTLLKQLSDEDPMAEQGPTQGFNLKTLEMHGRTAAFADLGGQRSIRDYWQDYYDTTDCIVFVVDSTDAKRLEECHQAFLEVTERMPTCPMLIFANKQDLVTAKPPDAIAESLNLVEMRTRKWHIQGCSAKKGDGVSDGMEWLMKNV